MDSKILEKIGLTKNEGLVYLSLLRRGTSKTGEILKESSLNSGKIYEILYSLEKKGLVSESVINNVKHYTAAPPSQILDYLKSREDEIKKDVKIIERAIPDLERIRETKLTQVKAATYVGLKGIKTAADEALEYMNSKQEILAMGVTERKDKKFNEFWRKWSLRRIEKRIIAKHIFSEKGDYIGDFRNMKFTEARLLEGLTPVAIDVFGDDRVLILNYSEPVSCTMLYDKNTASSFINFFYQLWEIAKK